MSFGKLEVNPPGGEVVVVGLALYGVKAFTGSGVPSRDISSSSSSSMPNLSGGAGLYVATGGAGRRGGSRLYP
jgi:hypothetical protein